MKLASLFLSVLLTASPGTAHAYLDPGTGSFILQMLIAGVLGALFYIKMAWATIRARLSSLFSKQQITQIEDEAPSDDE